MINKGLFRFGEFTLNSEALILLRQDEVVPLPPKVLGLLSALVQHRGEVVSKGLLMETVWPDTFVEESNLTQSIFLLRKSLGQTVDGQEYIQTLPKRGYRLAVPVDQIGLSADDAAGGVMSTAAKNHRRVRLSVLGGLLVLIGAAAVHWRNILHAPVLNTKRTILIGEFSNSTGDSLFSDILRQGMAVQLEQSPLIRLVSEQRIQNTLRLMGQSADVKATSALSREVCQRAGSAAVIDGSIVSLGNQYILGLQVTDCASGELLDAEQEHVNGKEAVLAALSRAASRVRTKLGESLASVQSLDTPLAEATTSSLGALQAYSEANIALATRGSAAALSLLQRAIDLDPDFAMAHSMMGRVYGDLGQDSRSMQSTARAYELRARASDRERFFIVATYQIQVTGDLEKARETCKTWERIYPDDGAALGFQAGLISRVFGQYEDGAEKAKRLLVSTPDFAIAYHLLAVNDLALGRLREAEDTLQLAAQRKLVLPNYLVDRYRLAFLHGDQAGMVRIATLADQQPAAADLIGSQRVWALAYYGHFKEARELSQRAVNVAQQAGREEMAARLEAAAAIRETLLGSPADAKRAAQRSLALSNGRDTNFGAAFSLAVAKDSVQATAIADDLDRRFQHDTAVRFHYVPVIRALVALNHQDPEKALTLLEPTRLYELGSPPSSFSGFFGVLYPAYVRGLTYLALNRSTEAADEFQKILDHPNLVVSDPVSVAAQWQLAKVYSHSGNTLKAKASYSGFLARWHSADDDIPILKQARAEYLRLR